MVVNMWNVDFAKVREGTVKENGKHKVYKCPAGYLTAGWGHNLEAHGIEDEIAQKWLVDDLCNAKKELIDNLSFWETLNDARQSVLIDMNFNMGWGTLSKFKRFFAALERADYDAAAAEMEDSRWFRQVGPRAVALQEMMISGKY